MKETPRQNLFELYINKIIVHIYPQKPRLALMNGQRNCLACRRLTFTTIRYTNRVCSLSLTGQQCNESVAAQNGNTKIVTGVYYTPFNFFPHGFCCCCPADFPNNKHITWAAIDFRTGTLCRRTNERERENTARHQAASCRQTLFFVVKPIHAARKSFINLALYLTLL